jgi:hypothetical protein
MVGLAYPGVFRIFEAPGEEAPARLWIYGTIALLSYAVACA